MPDDFAYQSFTHRDRVIHIVDSDLQTCEELSVLFRIEGFQTAFSVNLSGFFAAIERRRPDIIIANLELGDDGSLTLLRAIRSLRIGIPVFMSGTRPGFDGGVPARKPGAADVLTKPIDTDALVRSVREV